MSYIIEDKPMSYQPKGRRPNPIAVTMRKLKVGQSFTIKRDDPAWTGNQVRNENQRRKGKFVTEPTADGYRIGRVE